MYTKLAIQNMKKSIRNYVIYFVTITLTAAMMYSFLALGFSKEVLSMSENMSMLTSGILGMSVLVALIASFVISYAIRFMLEQRKKEFATYELLGMETSNIQKLFFIENGVIGMAACGGPEAPAARLPRSIPETRPWCKENGGAEIVSPRRPRRPCDYFSRVLEAKPYSTLPRSNSAYTA